MLGEALRGRIGTGKQLWLAQVLAIFVLVYLTNYGFADRFDSLFRKEKWLVLSVFVAIWALSVICLVIAAQQPNRAVRLFWAVVISLTTAVAHTFHLASGTDLNIFYVLSLWTARHEAGRAMEFYQDAGMWAGPVLLASLVIFYLPPAVASEKFRRSMSKLAWAPVIPILVMAAVLVVRNGSGSQAMPRQFQPLAIGLVSAGRILSDDVPVRNKPTWDARVQSPIRNVVVLVDESIRPDYIDWRPGNEFTPILAANKDRLINFGQAVSGGNCSSFSNAILRLGASRENLVQSVKFNPTIWQYAKRAGFRTVYIDAQSAFIKSDKKLQNFMTFTELRDVDRHVTFDKDIAAPQLDFKLLEELKDELADGDRVFIYANKNGAHFPYDAGYPSSETIFKPTAGANSERDPVIMINSYRNVVRWSVDRFFGELLAKLDLSETLIIYTSDHGQRFAQGGLTHCTVENPDPRQGLVPLVVATQDEALKSQLAQAARINHSRISHFAITPTVLEMLGYDRSDIRTLFGPSMFEQQTSEPAFTSEYIFGLFRSDVRWTKVDLTANYLESFSGPAKVQVESDLQAE